MKIKEIWRLYKTKILASIGAFAFIISGLVIYELKEPNNIKQVKEASAQVNNLQSQDISNNYDPKIFENVKYESDYAKEREQVQEQYIQVYITGGVEKPDVYKIKAGSRLIELVKMAGGLTAAADREATNLARFLNTDAEHIKIPVKAKINIKDAGQGGTKSLISIPGGDVNLSLKAQAKDENKVKAKAKGAAKREKTYEFVNINTAGLEELTKLKGIGPALAQRILDYRKQHGNFKSVNDLKKVRGIGNAKLKALSGQVILN